MRHIIHSYLEEPSLNLIHFLPSTSSASLYSLPRKVNPHTANNTDRLQRLTAFWVPQVIPNSNVTHASPHSHLHRGEHNILPLRKGEVTTFVLQQRLFFQVFSHSEKKTTLFSQQSELWMPLGRKSENFQKTIQTSC